MRPGARLVVGALVAVGVLGAGYVVGRGSRDDVVTPEKRHARHTTPRHHEDTKMPAGDHAGMDMSGSDTDTLGLAASQGGVQLKLSSKRYSPGAETLRFRILGAGGQVLTRFTREQQKLLHLIVVRSDLGSFQHLHPQLGRDGSWSVPATFPSAGTYRVIADFTPDGGARTVLGDTISVGSTRPPASGLPGPVGRINVDGYDVEVRTKRLTAGRHGTLVIMVTRDGVPVRLEPYLGAYGHAVLLRVTDLAYLHVHPQEANPAAGTAVFSTELPSPDQYGAFIQFNAEGAIHTAAVTINARDDVVSTE